LYIKQNFGPHHSSICSEVDASIRTIAESAGGHEVAAPMPVCEKSVMRVSGVGLTVAASDSHSAASTRWAPSAFVCSEFLGKGIADYAAIHVPRVALLRKAAAALGLDLLPAHGSQFDMFGSNTDPTVGLLPLRESRAEITYVPGVCAR
jgi:hypothetical protein